MPEKITAKNKRSKIHTRTSEEKKRDHITERKEEITPQKFEKFYYKVISTRILANKE